MILHDFLDKFNSQKKTFLEKVKKINGALAFITLSTLLIAFLVSSISSLSHNHLYYILSPLLLSIFTSSSITYLFFKKHITMKDKKDIQVMFVNPIEKNKIIEQSKKILLILDSMILSEQVNLQNLEKRNFLQPKPRQISKEDFILLKKIKQSKFLEENYLLFDALNEKEQKNLILKLKQLLPKVIKQTGIHLNERYSELNETELKQQILNLKEEIFFNNIKNDLMTELENEKNIENFEKNNLKIMHPKNNNIIYNKQDKERIEKEKAKVKKLSL